MPLSNPLVMCPKCFMQKYLRWTCWYCGHKPEISDGR
jgi:hypothetical protein